MVQALTIGAVPTGVTTARNHYLDLIECARGISTTSITESFRDYLYGAGLAINPLPMEPAHFYTSDRDALVSDWTTALTDMDRVWQTSIFIQNRVSEHLDAGKRRTETGKSAAKPAEATDVAGDNSSRT
jgi:hypothetical protein